MLQDFIDNKHYVFHESFDSWEDAIIASCQPLVDDNTIEPVYVQAVIDCVHEHGPYIVIAPDVAMPHSTANADGVNGTAISFMRVKEPVVFVEGNPDKNARLFFVLASTDAEKHMENIVKLTDILMNPDIIKDLLLVEDVEGLQAVADKYK